MKIQFPRGNRLRIILHIVGWSILFIIPSYLMYIDSNDDLRIFYIISLQTVAYAGIFYLNYLWLTPRLFFRNRKVAYFVAATMLVLVMSLLMGVADDTLRPKPGPKEYIGAIPPRQEEGPGWPGPVLPELRRGGEPGPLGSGRKRPPMKQWPAYNFLLTSVFITGFSIGLRYSDKVIMQEKQHKEAEKEKLNTELAFLKNQINPHFFFNTLNNIYSLVQTNLEDGQKAILQLSKLMRYLLYETEKGNILLSQEIEFMTNYIELMRLRLSGKVSLGISFPGEYRDLSLPPLLFLPFIENAFKHGISNRHPSFIRIRLQTTAEEITFECSNSLGSRAEDRFRTGSGIGLENVKKRLNLLFPLKHDLLIESTGQSFNVRLQISLVQNGTT